LRRRQLRHPLIQGWTHLCTYPKPFCVHPVSLERFVLPIYRRLHQLCVGVDPTLTLAVAP
jgi:hypothetical protein